MNDRYYLGEVDGSYIKLLKHSVMLLSTVVPKYQIWEKPREVGRKPMLATKAQAL